MLSELEFAKEKFRQLLRMMPILVEEAEIRAKNEQEFQAIIDYLLDRIISVREEIKRLQNPKNG